MRTIAAALTTAQRTLSGKPTISISIDGTNVAGYLLAYRYTEPGQLLLVLDNKAETFNTLPDYIHAGAPVILSRGIGSNTAALPTCYIEEHFYTYGNSRSTLVLICIDWKDRLRHWHAPTAQTWTATSAQTICEWILTQVGLTLMTGTLTALTTDFRIQQGESGLAALNRLMQRLPEFLYPGLGGEIKFKALDPTEAAAYTFDWNRRQSQHPVLSAEAGETAWEYNAVTFTGADVTGSASDATQQAAVGERHKVIVAPDMTVAADCEQAAESELSYYEAHAEQMTIVCRPCHGLELFDVVTLDNPPWGGADATARVIRITEQYAPGIWQQVISCGQAADKPGGYLRALAASALGNTNWEFYFYLTTLIEYYITTMVPDLLPEDLVYGGGSGAANRIAYWQDVVTLDSDDGLTVDPTGNFYVAADNGGLRNASNNARVQLNANGSLQTSSAGDARGTNAVDLQMSRANVNQVASGANAFTSGNGCRATNSRSHAQGYLTYANGQNAHAFNYGSQASGNNSHAEGYYTQTLADSSHAEGYGTVSSGQGSHAEGTSTTATQQGSHAEGDSTAATATAAHAEGANSAASLRAEHAQASGAFNVTGDAQLRRFVIRRVIATHTDTTWYPLFLDGASLRLTIPTDTLWQFDVMLVGLTQGAVQQWSYRLQGTALNDGGTVTLLDTAMKATHTESDAAYDVQATGNDTDNSLDIEVRRNGGSDYAIRWAATVQVMQVQFPA